MGRRLSTTYHVTNSLEGLYDTREVTENIKFSNGNEEYAMKIGKVWAMVQRQEGTTTTISSSDLVVMSAVVGQRK